MKKFLFALMLVCGSVSANEHCDASAEFAETVMTYKQKGATYGVSKVALDKTMNKSDPVYNEFVAILDWAYARTNSDDETSKLVEVYDFGQSVKKACNQAYKEMGYL